MAARWARSSPQQPASSSRASRPGSQPGARGHRRACCCGCCCGCCPLGCCCCCRCSSSQLAPAPAAAGPAAGGAGRGRGGGRSCCPGARLRFGGRDARAVAVGGPATACAQRRAPVPGAGARRARTRGDRRPPTHACTALARGAAATPSCCCCCQNASAASLLALAFSLGTKARSLRSASDHSCHCTRKRGCLDCYACTRFVLRGRRRREAPTPSGGAAAPAA
jgi:hypothetical protein